MINIQRMGDLFTELAQIDSESLDEAAVAARLEEILTQMGGEVRYDQAGDAIGGNCSNLVARFKGNCDAEPIFLSGHMDTVVPGKGVKVIFEDGVFRSDGTTI
ncbi:MAG: peptidase T, partial [Desulfobacterales bacterium]|nr:peptidase T [Desulfobacterales bacterium]